MAWAYFITGQKDKALEQARKSYDLEPSHPLGRWILCQPIQNRECTRQWHSRTVAPKRSHKPILRFERWNGLRKSRTRDKAEEMISKFRDLAKTQYVPTCRIAAIYGALGEKDKAFAELDKSFEARDWELFRFNVDTYWKSLRDDPRFASLVKRLNLPE